MSITDELREYVTSDRLHYAHNYLAIADRIDVEHKRRMADAKLADAPTEAQLSEWGYVELPKDADGEYIHIGDVMEWPTTHETFEVVGIGDGTLFYIEDGRERADWTGASTKRHHHAPTVEDVLREFAADIAAVLGGDDFLLHNDDDLYAEYAAKLRLAGEE